MAQLNTVWLHMGGKNFLCDHEERSFFIMRSMHTLIEVYVINNYFSYKCILSTVITSQQTAIFSRKI